MAYACTTCGSQRLWPSPPPGPDAALFLSARGLGLRECVRMKVEGSLALTLSASDAGNAGDTSVLAVAALPAPRKRRRRPTRMAESSPARSGRARKRLPLGDAPALRVPANRLRSLLRRPRRPAGQQPEGPDIATRYGIHTSAGRLPRRSATGACNPWRSSVRPLATEVVALRDPPPLNSNPGAHARPLSRNERRRWRVLPRLRHGALVLVGYAIERPFGPHRRNARAEVHGR